MSSRFDGVRSGSPGEGGEATGVFDGAFGVANGAGRGGPPRRSREKPVDARAGSARGSGDRARVGAFARGAVVFGGFTKRGVGRTREMVAAKERHFADGGSCMNRP